MNQQRPQKKTTIYDLAELAGTSASAVSAVLNGNWKKRRISSQLAEKITRIAEEQGYAINMQASLLRREKSRIIGMIVPKYDNRYFGSIVETFEIMARARGLFPIITCTLRDPDLEVEAARTMLSYQVEWLISTGATDPDRITDICLAAGTRSLNLDLPGTKATSIISDNFAGARELTKRTLLNHQAKTGVMAPLLFIGGRGSDHNTAERIRGFRMAHQDLGVPIESITSSPAATPGQGRTGVERHGRERRQGSARHVRQFDDFARRRHALDQVLTAVRGRAADHRLLRLGSLRCSART